MGLLWSTPESPTRARLLRERQWAHLHRCPRAVQAGYGSPKRGLAGALDRGILLEGPKSARRGIYVRDLLLC